ncbi:MAG TPA: hypothetical protein VF877_01760 [Gaiellaceae bacterium]
MPQSLAMMIALLAEIGENTLTKVGRHLPRFWPVVMGSICVLALTGGVAYATALDTKLPPRTLRGPENRLRQYPILSLVTSAQLAAAKRLRSEMWPASRAWRSPRAAAAAGYDPDRLRRPGNTAGLFLHAENRKLSNDDQYLEPRHPEVLIFANAPGRPLVLIGVMFSVPRGVHGSTPGGPITRWHTHRVCARGAQRGLTPSPDGSCPPGTQSRQGAEMLHFWFTSDLRSAYAIHGPVPELCAARLLYHESCHHTSPGH